MGEHEDTVRRCYQAFAEGDIESVLDLARDDIEWNGTAVEGLPGSGNHSGKDAVVSMLGEIPKDWEKFELEADEYIEAGDTVVVLGHINGKAKPTNRDVRVPFAHVWKLAGGKLARVITLGDTAILAAALNLRPKAQ